MKLPRRCAHVAAILISLLLLLPSAGAVAEKSATQSTAPDQSSGTIAASGEWTLRLPAIQRNYVLPAGLFSRFGVGAPAVGDISVMGLPTYRLNVGWYLDWAARQIPPRPGGIGYAHMIHLRMDGPPSPSGSGLDATVRANPGALWLIGNEPDSPHKNAMTPEAYATNYHDLYHQIKAVDPTALVSAGGIAQPTPLRMRYLDRILEEYARLYGSQMPVDVWNTHLYILPEVPEEEASGPSAFLPVGITDEAGERELYDIQDHDNIDIFKEMVVRFRQWMADNGYQDRPLIITEFGIILHWSSLDPDQQKANARVLAFMDESIDFLLTASDPAIGCPDDGNRLVQRWAWFALAGSWSGWLFEMDSGELSMFGQRYAELAAAQPRTVNLRPTRLATVPSSGIRAGAGEVRLQATISNNGEVQAPGPIAVRFYDGDPNGGGMQIGETQFVAPLDGGAGLAIVSVPWTPAEAKTYRLYVQVDSPNSIHETNEGDNAVQIDVTVSP